MERPIVPGASNFKLKYSDLQRLTPIQYMVMHFESYSDEWLNLFMPYWWQFCVYSCDEIIIMAWICMVWHLMAYGYNTTGSIYTNCALSWTEVISLCHLLSQTLGALGNLVDRWHPDWVIHYHPRHYGQWLYEALWRICLSLNWVGISSGESLSAVRRQTST